MKKIITTGFILSALSTPVLAVDASHAATNPANVMNTLDNTLPGAQAPNQGEFRTTTNPQYIKHAREVTHQVVLKKVQLLNANVIPDNVQAIYQKLIGQKVSFKDIQNLANSLEAAYRADGYILVQVILPPQEINIDSGVVQLQVVNGEIKQIIFTGDDPKGARAQLHRYAEQVEVEDPVSYHSIDRFLVLANQLPGIDVSATLMPDKKFSGAADLVVKVEHTPASAFININNRGTAYIGPYQSSMGASAYDLLGADSLTVTGATSLNAFHQMQYGSIDYNLIAGTGATEINPSITKTAVHPGGSLSDLEMAGTSTKYNLSVNQPIYTSTLQNFTVQSSLYHVDSKNNAYDGEETLYDDHISAFSLGLNYQGSFFQTYHDITLSATNGMPIFGTPSTLSQPSVANAKTSFLHFNLATSSIRYLTQRISAALSTQFQYSKNTLVSSEQIGFGGQQFGQAFTPYIISGNSGLMGSIAVRYDVSPMWGFRQIQPQIFYDAGSVYYSAVTGTTNNHATAQSAGLGVNLQWLKNTSLGLTLAKPVTITETPNTSMGWVAFFNLTVTM